MASEILSLRNVRAAPPDPSCLAVAAELLQALATVVTTVEPEPDDEPLVEELRRQQAALEGRDGGQAIADMAEPIVTTSRAAVAAVRRRQASRRDDIAGLVAMVRNTVQSLTADQTASSTALGESAARLDQLQQVTNFSALKQLLAEEVVMLRQTTREREQEYARVVGNLAECLATAEEQLCQARTEALTDALTEVANRRGFDTALARRLKEQSPTSALVLALFDVDSFKRINDSFGHASGDAILRHVARAIRDAVRQDDVVARIGGDEFAMIASGLTLMQAKARLQAIVQAVVGTANMPEGVTVSLSCGASEYSAGDTAQTLMHRADTALGEAKALGKNRVVTRTAPYIRTLLRPRS